MLYSLTYKKFSDITKGILLVQAEFDVAGFYIGEIGTLVLYNRDKDDRLVPLAAYPTGGWMLIEPVAAGHNNGSQIIQ